MAQAGLSTAGGRVMEDAPGAHEATFLPLSTFLSYAFANPNLSTTRKMIRAFMADRLVATILWEGGRALVSLTFASRIRQWNSKKFMCPWCHAHRDGELSWHDFSLGAPWAHTCRNHLQFVADIAASRAHGWRKDLAAFAYCPKIVEAPFFSWSMVVLDWMHDVDMGLWDN